LDDDPADLGFNRYRGMWLAFEEDEETVLAAAKTSKEALADAIAKGFSAPILYRVPDTLEAFVGYEV